MAVEEITTGITWAELASADGSGWRAHVLDRIDARPGFWECAPVLSENSAGSSVHRSGPRIELPIPGRTATIFRCLRFRLRFSSWS